MNLYEVVRWGNDSDDIYTGGPNGHDTCFLVRAESVAEAAVLVDRELADMSHKQVRPWAGAVYLIGTDAGTETNTRILRGPYYQPAYYYGWRQWYRVGPEESWEEKLPKPPRKKLRQPHDD